MSKPLQIKIKYHTDIPKIEKIEQGDWIDLRAAEDVKLSPHEFKLISLGVSMQIPPGYEAHLAPRSSSFKNWGFIQTNSVGVVDLVYSGDTDIWRLPVYALRQAQINKGDRICQFRIIEKMPPIEFVEVDSLNNPSRGGFGSTGKE